jgi:protein SCO1
VNERTSGNLRPARTDNHRVNSRGQIRYRHRRRPARRRGREALLLAVLLFGAVACSSGSGRPAEPGSTVGQSMDAQLPPQITAADLVTSSGHRVDLASFRGKVVVISDMMTLCQETCPIDTAEVVQAARLAERNGLGSRIEFLSITVDPVRDTPARLAAYRALYQPAPKDWLTLTGTPATLARLWKVLGVFTKKVADQPPAPRDWLTGKPLTYDITHSDEVFFLGGNGLERFLLEGPPHLAAGAPIPSRIRSFMDASGRKSMNHPGAGAWTLAQELQVLSWLLKQRIAGG